MTERGRTATGAAPLLTGVRDEIRSKLNIAAVVGGYVQLRQAGRALVGLCPFHHEKTPSFHVDPQKGLYHCFGCKEGGDLFDFIMKVEGLTFPEALAFLAEKAGVEIPQTYETAEDHERNRQLNAMVQANTLAQSFYARVLFSPMGKAAQAYLKRRGIRVASARKFGLGFAPNTWDALTKHLADAGLLQAGIAAGVLVAKGDSNAYDRFRGRVMFPIANVTGKIVAFGGRALDGGEPKYLNCPETQLFAKRQQLFGFNQAKDAIRRQGRAIIVEGYFDCITLHQAGVNYAVASCGTALTSEHVQLLHRVARELYLCFDGDNAGRGAVIKGLDLLQGTELPVRVVLLPDGHDPDTFVQQEGPDAFLGLLQKALPLTDYLLENAVGQADMGTIEGRMKGVRAALPILRQVKSAVERDAYIQRIAVRLGLSAQILAHEVAEDSISESRLGPNRHTITRNRNTIRDSASHNVALSAVNPRELLEKELLKSILRDPDSAGFVAAELGEAPFRSTAYNTCFQAALMGERDNALLDKVNSVLGLDATNALLSGDACVPWQECLAKMGLEHMREELAAMEEGLATLTDYNPAQYITHISNSLMAFRRWRKALREHYPSRSQAS